MDNINHKKLLHEVLNKLVEFSQVEVDSVLKHFTFKTYSPKELIFNSGDIIEDVYFVLDGIGRYFYVDKEGNERNKSLVRKGGAFASVSTVVEGSPSPFCTQAITRCVTASIMYDRLIELSEKDCKWSVFVRRVYERLVIKKEKREAGFLMLTARERYEVFLNEFGDDSNRLPLRQVAMYIGVTDVTLSRIRREMGLT